MKTGIYILSNCHLNAIRDCIIDNNISEGDRLLLSSDDFKKIVVEYKDKFGIGMTTPYTLLGVGLEEDVDVSSGSIKLEKAVLAVDSLVDEDYQGI